MSEKERRERHWRKKYEAAPEIQCKCGCGTLIKSVSWYGRKQEYVNGHNNKKYEDPKQHKREWVRRNLKSRIEYSKNFSYKRKIKLIELKGNKCKNCGLTYDGKNGCVFDFHHRVREEKRTAISLAKINFHSWAKILDEAEKCDLLCANCHRLFHGGAF